MNVKHLLITSLFIFSPLIANHAIAGDATAGKAKAATCAGCHGENGISVQDDWPNLAGQKAAYLENALKAYRDGTRKNDLMSGMAAGLSDQDIANLAAYYSNL